MQLLVRREEALADVQTNEVLHFVSESGMIEYLRLRHYEHVDSAAALEMTRQIPQGGSLSRVSCRAAPLATPGPVMPGRVFTPVSEGEANLTPPQLALQHALAAAAPPAGASDEGAQGAHRDTHPCAQWES